MKVLFTSALIPNQYELRKTQYIESYNCINNYIANKDINIIETFSSEPSFLSDLNENVFITNTNKHLRNKGVLEINSIKKFLDNTSISDDEMLLKITGRYYLLNNSLITIINDSNCDFIGKLIDNNTQVFTGCYAMKKKCLYDFVSNVNTELMEQLMINIEFELLKYIHLNTLNTLFLDTLNVEANIFGTGDIMKVNV